MTKIDTFKGGSETNRSPAEVASSRWPAIRRATALTGVGVPGHTYMVNSAEGSLTNWTGDTRRCSFAPNPPKRRWRSTIAAVMTGYFARLWRGQLALAQACGINGLLVVLPLALWAWRDAAHPPTSLSALALFALLPLLLIFGLGVLSAVGIWRSTVRRPMFGRQESVWATRIAQVLVVLNVILAIAAGARLVGDVRVISASRQQPGQGYEVALRGTSAVFSGRLSASAVAEVQLLLGDKSVLMRNNGAAGFSNETAAFPFVAGKAVDGVVTACGKVRKSRRILTYWPGQSAKSVLGKVALRRTLPVVGSIRLSTSSSCPSPSCC